jgi:heme/copper-type cytochrome/quinol oxidase subunit 2
MKFLLAIALVIVVILFGFSSMSQSYATAQQAQAAIEASRTAQIASAGNLVVIVTLAVFLLVAICVIAYLLLYARQPGQRKNSRPNTGQVPLVDMSSLFPAMLTMLLLHAMQKQNHPEADMLFRSRYEDDVALLEDEDTIPWMMM